MYDFIYNIDDTDSLKNLINFTFTQSCGELDELNKLVTSKPLKRRSELIKNIPYYINLLNLLGSI